jgi:phage FluMu protein Com
MKDEKILTKIQTHPFMYTTIKVKYKKCKDVNIYKQRKEIDEEIREREKRRPFF